MAHSTGHINAYGQGSRSLVFTEGFPTGAHHTGDTTHERDRSIEYRLRFSSEAELHPCLHIRNSCASLHVIVNSLCTSPNSFTDPTVCGLSIAHGTFQLEGTRSHRSQAKTDVPGSGANRSSSGQMQRATLTSAQRRTDCRRTRGRGPRHHFIYRIAQLPAAAAKTQTQEVSASIIRSWTIAIPGDNASMEFRSIGKLHRPLRARKYWYGSPCGFGLWVQAAAPLPIHPSTRPWAIVIR